MTLKSTPRRGVLAALLALAVIAPAASAQTTGDSVQSDNVEHVGNFREIGTGVGGTIIGDYFYVTSTHALLIYDIKKNPAAPELVGTFTLNVQFENEEVPTNGKILGISSDTYCVTPDDPLGAGTIATGGCLAIYDVSDPANVKLLDNVPGAGNHTSACILDCTYMYGDGGAITDLRDPTNAKLLETSWIDSLEEQGYAQREGCHHVREITPGIILGSCLPVVVMSVRPEDGGSVEKPVLLAQGDKEQGYIQHSSRWPRQGKDKFVLVGGEANAQPQCTDTVSSFQTWDASKVTDGKGGFIKGSAMELIDEIRPVNGTISDGNSAYNILGCSVHWFMEHPTFNNGGLVALAEYENGARFLQIEPTGRIVEQGYFLPTGGSSSAPHWNPHDPTIVYNVDYTRGIDVLRWKGDFYVPNAQGQVIPDPSKVPGTAGKQPGKQPQCASAAGFNSAKVAPKGKKLTFKVNRREQRPFAVDVFQQTQGRKVIGNRLIARFKNKTKSFTWNGKDRKGRRLGRGNYFVRFKMKTASGAVDTRRATLRYSGRFRKAPNFYQRVDCGAFRSLKLSSSAFGGTTKEPLGVSYKLAIQVRNVKIQFKVGKKVVKKVTGKGQPNRTFRFKLPAGKVKRGKKVKVVVTANRAPAASPRVTLAANRL